MCRIAGIIDTKRTSVDLQQEVKAMCDVMAHGGPDGEGFYLSEEKGMVFGHRRLSLIDLSPTGKQPMLFNTDRLAITFNGEIYNYLELKAELSALGIIFKTQSDTEVILASYQTWGIDSFEKLDGMFAFGLYSKSEDKTYLVRDRSGIKPLYFACNANRLIFSSEVKAFHETSYFFEENPDWKVYMLAFGHIPEPFSTLKGIKMLAKGHYLSFDHALAEFKIDTFLHNNPLAKINDVEEAKSLVELYLRRAVKSHLISDAPIGVFLSGGIDSSILTLLANESCAHNLNTVSINFDDQQFSEEIYQQEITQLLNGKHSSYLVTKEIFEQKFPMAIKAMDQPSADGINSWFVNYYAKENGLKAVLSGIGADELFGGYPSFKRMKLVNSLSRLPRFLLKLARYAGGSADRIYYLSYKNTIGKYLFLRGFFTPTEISRILNLSIKKVNDVLSHVPSKMPKLIHAEEQASWLEEHLYMQNQLLKDTDSMSMQHGVEVRVPFLDNELMKNLARINNDLKYNTSLPKGLLIDAFKKILSQQIWDRKKMGFTFPFQNWLKENDFFLASLQKNNNPFIRQTTAAYLNGKVHWSKMMALYQINSFDHK